MTQDMHAAAGGALRPPARKFTLSLLQVTSVILVTTRKRRALTASSPEEFRDFHREVLVHNLTLGWWGLPFGLIWTPVALIQNQRAVSKLRGLMATGAAPAGWYQDPTGKHQNRYWDGARWTDRVGDTNVSSDPAPTT